MRRALTREEKIVLQLMSRDCHGGRRKGKKPSPWALSAKADIPLDHVFIVLKSLREMELAPQKDWWYW